ncbi:MAG: sulfatase [Rubripirellula sp.]|nr:sulfatase [Rubripirellula sp.]
MRHLLIAILIIFSFGIQLKSNATETNICPNIVFILIDDLRHDTFGHAGHPFIQTPHIDQLAWGGLRFTNAFVTTSLCSPSRATFLTGKYMHNHKVVDNSSLMKKQEQTFPQKLKEADYRTAFIGKWHMGGSSDAARPGFDHWVSFRGQGTYQPEGQFLNINGKRVPQTKYMTDELTNHATQWLSSQTPEHPFMLYLSHKGVHGLYDPAPRHLNQYENASYSRPATMANTPENNSGKPMWVQDQRNSWHGVEFPYHGRAKQSIDEMYRHYCEMILSIDDSVGRILETLQTKGISEKTLVLFTSDGGHLWGEHGLIDKRCAYEESIRIPLLAYWPSKIAPKTRSDALVANIDIAPTLLELANLAIPASMDGNSLVPLLREANSPQWGRKSLLYEYYWEPAFPQTPTTFALRNKQYKLIQYHGLWDTDELYDVGNDPTETINLINDPDQTQRIAAMRKELHRRLSQSSGLSIPLGIKRNHGSNLRNSQGSRRAEFPNAIIRSSSH